MSNKFKKAMEKKVVKQPLTDKEEFSNFLLDQCVFMNENIGRLEKQLNEMKKSRNGILKGLRVLGVQP